MKSLRQYDIFILKLSDALHHYDFEVDKTFFEQFEHTPVESGDLEVELDLDKKQSHLEAHFRITGFVELTCDRTLEKFDHPINVEHDLIFKYAEERAELSDEMVTITYDEQKINVAQYIFEYIGLAIPMKILHPKFENEKESEEDKLIYTSIVEEEEDDKEEKVDPRWEALNKLKEK